MVPTSFTMDVSIPQVGDPVSITTEVMNMGNVKAEAIDVAFLVDGAELDRTTVDLFPGSIRSLPWTWTPTVAGTSEVMSALILMTRWTRFRRTTTTWSPKST